MPTEKGLIGFAFRLLDDGAGNARKIQAEGLSATVPSTAENSEFYSKILVNDPENLTALQYFLKLNRYNDKAGGEWFAKLIYATMRRDFQYAVHLVRDYYPKHLDFLPGDVLFRIGVEFHRYADHEKALLCLELAARKKGTWQHKAMLILSRSCEALGNQERAITILLDLLRQEPDIKFRPQAMKRLMILQEQSEILKKLNKAA